MTFWKYHNLLFICYISGNSFSENILLYIAYYGWMFLELSQTTFIMPENEKVYLNIFCFGFKGVFWVDLPSIYVHKTRLRFLRNNFRPYF